MNLNPFKLLLLAAISISCLCSCHRNHFDEALLIGDWSSVEANGPYGFIFQAGGICDYKGGFRTYFPSRKYLGTRTKYFIDSDTLKIVNISYNKFTTDNGGELERFLITKLTKDTLVLGETPGLIFKKNHPEKNHVSLFDQVIVNFGGCFGPCSPGYIMISRSGDVYYKSEAYHDESRPFKSKVSFQLVDSIESDFKISDFINLKNDYSSGYTDQSTTSLMFVKNNKIIKQISDYGHASPTDFKYAYQRFPTLNQKLHLTETQPDAVDLLWYLQFRNKRGQVGGPSTTCEEFYLLSMLRLHQVEKADFIFPERYLIVSPYITNAIHKGIVKAAETDGQVFKILSFSGKSYYYDLGFNYIKNNNLEHKFEFQK